MPFVIVDGKLVKAKPVKRLTVAQKKVMRMSTRRQSRIVRAAKAKLQRESVC